MSKKIICKSFFWKFWTIWTLTQQKQTNFLPQQPSKNIMFQTEFIMEEFELELAEEYKFEN